MTLDLTLAALLVTSAATVAYATLTYLLLIETRKEKKKSIIEEILGVVLYPLLQLLNEEASDFKKGNARLSFVRGKFKTDWKINDLYSWDSDILVYQNFRKSYLEIANMIDKHDAFISELIIEGDSIAEVLYTPDFKKKCDELLDKWEEKVEHQILFNALKRDQLYENILTYIVNNSQELPERHLVYEFWKINHEIFFKEKERIAKKQSINLENKLCEVEIFTNSFLMKIEKLIENYQKKYGIAAKFVTEKYDVYRKFL